MLEFERKWRERFAEYGTLYDDDAGIAGWSSTGLETRFRQFVNACELARVRGVWLDAGCGAGTYSRFLASKGVDVLAVDYSIPSLIKASARVRSGVRFIAGDATRLPFKPEIVDGVLCFGVTQALSETSPVLQELTAVCRPGGQVWIDALNQWCVPHMLLRIRRRLDGKPRHLRYESARRLVKIMCAAGLTNIRMHWMPILPARWQRLQPIFEGSLARWFFAHVPLVSLIFCHSFMIVGEKSPASAPRSPPAVRA